VKHRPHHHVFDNRPLYVRSVWLDQRHWLEEPWIHVGLVAALVLGIWLVWLLITLIGGNA
jgi:hypothetical protein